MSTRRKLIIGSLLALCLGALPYLACSQKKPGALPFAPRATLPGTTVQGTIAANAAAVSISTAYSGTLSIQLTGTWTGTVGFQLSYDGGTTWQNASAFPQAGGASVQSTTANGVWLMNVAGSVQAQVVATSWGNGTANITLSPSPASTAALSVAAASTGGGATPYQLISTASNNATSLKGSAGQVYLITATNFNTANARYLKFYSKATAPAPASDTPLLTISIPAAVSASQPSVVTISGPAVGINFAAGIGFAIVANLAVNDNTSVGANDVEVNIGYN